MKFILPGVYNERIIQDRPVKKPGDSDDNFCKDKCQQTFSVSCSFFKARFLVMKLEASPASYFLFLGTILLFI